MSCDDSILSLNDVLKNLEEIENKYDPNRRSREDCGDDDILFVLSQEFDSLGLPKIDFSAPKSSRLQQVVAISRMLVQLHRKVIAEVKDVNINCRSKDSKSGELHKKIDELKIKLQRSEDRNAELKSQIFLHIEEQNKLQAKINQMKEEMDKIKRYHTSKLKEMDHTLIRLMSENKKIKEKIGDTYCSKDEVTIKLMTKYKMNEEVYKTTIKKLQENNQALLAELTIAKTGV